MIALLTLAQWMLLSTGLFSHSAFAQNRFRLREKIKEHRDSRRHLKAAKIEKMASRSEINKKLQEMHRSDHNTSFWVF